MRIALIVNFAFSILVISLAGAVSVGVPIKYVTWPALVLTIILLAVGVRKAIVARRKVTLLAAGVLLCGSVAFSIGPSALRGGFPSQNPDCWAYAAFGQYLTDFPRGTSGGLPYVDQFAQLLSNTRFGSASLLGFLSQILETNTARAIVIFDALVLVNCFLGCFCVARVCRASPIASLASAIFFVGNGWMTRAVREGQLDNLIFLSLIVFVLARVLLLLRNVRCPRASIGIGASLAAACYSYPEGVAIAASFGLPLAAAVLFWFRRDYRHRWKEVVLIIGSSVLFLAPYLPTAESFLINQVSTTYGSVRPGNGMYPGLTLERLFPAVFALGEEMSKVEITGWRLILPVSFVVLILLGVLKSRFRAAFAITLCILLGAIGWELGYFHYDYAAYKFIFAGTIIWVPMIFVGVSRLAGPLHQPARTVVGVGFVLILLGGTAAQRVASPLAAPFRDAPLTDSVRIRKYEEVSKLGRMIGGSTLAIACSDPFKYLWTYYFARKLPVQLVDYKSDLTYAVEALQLGRQPTGPLRFVLTDQPDQQAIWTNYQFWLSELSGQTYLLFSQSDNSLEHLDGELFTWIGNNPTKFEIISDTAAKVRFSCTSVIDGGSLPGRAERSVKVTINGKDRILRADDLYALDLHVDSGITFLEISCLDQPTRLLQTNGDTRIMLVGLKGFRVTRLP
jgi:hypothetical protein